MGKVADISSFVLTFVLILVGAGIYIVLEQDNETELAEAFIDYEEEYQEEVRAFAEKYNQSYEYMWTLVSNYTDAAGSATDPSAPNWEMSGAAFFCLTVMTTIGYGTFAPSTDGGKTFIIFYTMLTVPAFLFTLARCSVFLDWCAKKLKAKVLGIGEEAANLPESVKRAREKKDRLAALFGLPILMIVMVFAFASGFNYAYDDWTFLDSVYYNIITLTTVGLGDYAPHPDPDESSAAMLFFGFYVCMGLAALGCFINAIQSSVVAAAQKSLEKKIQLEKTREKEWKDKQKKKGWHLDYLDQLHLPAEGIETPAEEDEEGKNDDGY